MAEGDEAMRAIRAALSIMLMLMTAGACRHPGAEPPVRPDPNMPVEVQVENHYFGDVVVYLAQGSQSERLGMVTALSSATFSFPWRRLALTGTSRLLAYPIAGTRAYTSDPLLVQPGQSISWTLEADLDRSTMTVY